MTELDDLEIDPAGRDASEPTFLSPPPRPPFGLIAMGLLLIVSAGVLGYRMYRQRPQPTPSPVTLPPALVATPTPVPSPEAVGLPSLDASDTLVRELGQALSTHPLLGAWLGQQGLVRLVVVVVDNVANRESPRPHLLFLAPKGSFAVVQKKGRILINPTAYSRFDFFAEGVASLDVQACAALHRRLLPLTEAAYRELGHPQGGFADGLQRALRLLLAVPVLDGEVEVRATRRGTQLVHVYADPGLEALSPPQKQLLRMGPDNVRRIQAKLRELSEALSAAPSE